MLALSFLTLILVGAGLLYLPASHHGSLSILDAVFTATSAVCVTGLIVVDTGLKYTYFGQAVILVLIQLGGLGIMTFSTFFAYIFAGRLSIRGRDLVERTIGGMPMPQLGKLVLVVVFGTFLIELIGAFLLTMRFAMDMNWGNALYHGVFHSISAFCNAGFSLNSNSLVAYQTDLVVNFTVMSLIVLGGLGFWVIFDFQRAIRNKRKLRSLTLHSKLVLSLTLVLVFAGLIVILFTEWNNTLAKMPISSKVLASLFHSVTARTAGFNTLNLESMANGTLFFVILLMMIGASPGSCGGGIKTTTFAVLIGLIIARFQDRQQVRLFHRGIPETVISKAITIAFFWLFAIGMIIMIMLISEHPGGPHEQGRTLFFEIVFETFSAMGTVGLSVGLSPLLSVVGKWCIIFLMFIGRIGPLTVALAVSSQKPRQIRFVEEDFIVG